MANYDVDYYKQLKDENYKTLLSSEIQLDNARQRALKQTNVGLASQGMNSSGYGSTINTGLENQYLSQLQSAQQNYQTQNQTIDQNAREAQVADANDQFNSLTTLMSNAGSNDNLNSIMQNYGYMNTDGSWNQEALNKLDQDSRLQLQSIYGLYNSQNTANVFNEALNGLSTGSFSTLEDLERYKTLSGYDKMTDAQKQQYDYYYNKVAENLQNEVSADLLKETTFNSKGYSSYEEALNSGEMMTGKEWGASSDGRSEDITAVKDELKVLYGTLTNNNTQNGTVAALANGNSGNIIYMIYYNGSWYKTNRTQFLSSNNKEMIVGGKIAQSTDLRSLINLENYDEIKEQLEQNKQY